MLRSTHCVNACALHAWDVRAFDEVTSTNLVVKDLIRSCSVPCQEKQAGALEDRPYFAAISLRQTEGYGRQGRSWSSPSGGLYASFGLPVPRTLISPLPTMSLVCSLAVKDVLDDLMVDRTCAIKWPNDIMVEGGKICGISLESINAYFCVGIGLNVFHPEDDSIQSSYSVRYVSDYVDQALAANRQLFFEQLVRNLIARLEEAFDQWCHEGFEPFKSRFESCVAYRGSSVDLELIDGSTLVSGTIQGIDTEGRLRIDCAGEVRSFASGEVHLKKRAI